MKFSSKAHRCAALDVVALVCVFVVVIIPNRLEWITPGAFVFLPLEPIVAGLLLVVSGWAGRALRAVLAVLLAIGLVFKVADLIVYEVFARPFNPVFDLYLLDDGLRLVTGAFGRVDAIVLALLLLLVFALIFLLAFGVLGRLQQRLQQSPRFSLPALGGLLGLWLALYLAGFPRVNTYFYDEMVEHVSAIVASVQDIKTFAATVNDDKFATTNGEQLLTKLRGKDVLVIFVESYGRTVFDDAEFAKDIKPSFEQAGFQLSLNGLQARTAYLTSPTVGGISWLAHGTLLSGLWINSQLRYDSLVLSERATLNRLFKRAGWRTLGVMPAISMAWPEGQYFGFDQIYNAGNLGYKGLPFNWITMPDQFVMAALQGLERNQSPRPPLMAEIALISSHAPWTPVPELIRWSEVGDGTVFNGQAVAGPDPDAVWEDTNRIRTQYRLSIDYVINTLASYAIQFGDDNLVMLVVGDHQPAPLVTNDSPSNDVPVHIIARDPAVFAAIADWHWSEGLVPAPDAPVWRMDSLRDRFVEAFSKP
ncbi:MAG: hypothetical protein WCI66_06060 [Gammaproteobacteria bacterium]